MSTHFESLWQDIERGIEGVNAGLDIGLPRASKYIGLRKGIYIVIVSASGMGKSTIVHNNYILNPYEHYKSGKTKNKFKVFLFNQERSTNYILCRWLCRKIFLDQGILIPVAKMLGWWEQKLTMDEKNLIHEFKPYLDEMLETKDIEIISGPQNPEGIRKCIEQYALENGKIEQVDKYHKVYLPNNPNELVLVVVDHFGLLKKQTGILNKKEAIDKVSEEMQKMNSFYGYTTLGISQINRDLNFQVTSKLSDVEPTLEMLKDSGNPVEAAELVISIFDPLRYDYQKTLHTDKLGYEPYKMEDKTTGERYYRRIKVLKNSYGASDIALAACMMGSTGIVKELPKSENITQATYDSILSNNYFLQ